MSPFERETSVTSLLEMPPTFTRQKAGGVFIVIRGPDRGEQVSLGAKPITFGSSPACDLVLTDKTVSRRHLEAIRQGEEVVLKDMGSTNGSFIAGSRFREITIETMPATPALKARSCSITRTRWTWTFPNCGDGWGWCSRSPTLSRSQSLTMLPTA